MNNINTIGLLYKENKIQLQSHHHIQACRVPLSLITLSKIYFPEYDP